MTLYGLVDHRLRIERPLEQVIELYGSRQPAERAMRAILDDEPGWEGALEVLELPLVDCPIGPFSLN